MGIYLDSPNDTDSSKSAIINSFTSLKRIASAEALNRPDEGRVRLCLVNNGIFCALAVLDSEREANAFCGSDSRPRSFFDVDIAEAAQFTPDGMIELRWGAPSAA